MNGILEQLVLALGIDVDEGSGARAERMLTAIDAAVVSLATAAAAGVAALFHMTERLASTEDAAAETARAVGVTVETLTELDAIGRMSGIEDMAGSLRFLARSASAAADDGGPAADVFHKMGITTAELRKLGPDELMERIADGMTRIDGERERVRAAMAIFGRSGAGMLNIIGDGAASLRAMREEARTFGVVVSTDAARASGSLADNVDRLRLIGQGMLRRFLTPLVPVFDRIIKRMLGWWKANGRVIGQRLEAWGERVGRAIEALAGPLGVVLGLFTAWRAVNLAGTLSSWVQGLGLVKNAMAAFGVTSAVSLAPILAVVAAVVAAALAWEDFTVAAEGGDSVLGDLAASMGVGSEFQAAAASLLNMLDAAWEAFTAIGDAVLTGMLTPIARVVPWVQTLLDLFVKLKGLELGKVFAFLTRAFDASAAGLRGAAAQASADADQQRARALGFQGPMMDPIMAGRAAAAAETARQREAAGTTINGGPVNVTVNANGLDEAAAERVARRAVREAVVDGLGATEGGAR